MVDANGAVLGKICHIRGDQPGARRYDVDQSEDERRSFDNLILLCPFHHAVIDVDDTRYTPEYLQQMKLQHAEKISQIRQTLWCSPKGVLHIIRPVGNTLQLRFIAAFFHDEGWTITDEEYENIRKSEPPFLRFVVKSSHEAANSAKVIGTVFRLLGFKSVKEADDTELVAAEGVVLRIGVFAR